MVVMGVIRSGYQFEVLSFEVFLAVELLLSECEDLPLLLLLQFTQFLTSLLLQRQQILILIRHAPAGTPPIRRREPAEQRRTEKLTSSAAQTCAGGTRCAAASVWTCAR